MALRLTPPLARTARLCHVGAVSDRAQSAAPRPSGDAATASANVAKSAGRGGLAIAAAKIFFMVTGLAQQIALKHILGLQTAGALGRIQGLASIIYNPIVATDVQGVSRALSGADDDQQAATQRRVLSMHCAAAPVLGAALYFGAPALTDLIKAPHLTTGLRIMAAVLLFYGLYTPLVGVINGRKRFATQAGLDVLAASLRTVGLLGGAWYFSSRGAGILGALGGFSIAAALMALVALPLAGIGRRGPGGPTLRQHLRFVLPLFGGQLALNLLLQADLQLLGRFAADAAVLSGLPANEADRLAGAYRYAQLFCFLPYQLLISITFVLFPLLATAHRDGDHQAVKRYVATGVRLALLLAGLLVSVTAGLSKPLLLLVFGQDVAQLSSRAMPIMALGLGAFAIFGVLAAVLTSLKRERMSAALTVAALLAVGVLCTLLTRGQRFGEEMLPRTAIATAIGLFAATAAAAHQVHRIAGRLVPLKTLLRVLLALAIAITCARLLPAPGKLMTLGYALGVALLYLLTLLGSREISRAEATRMLRIIR